MTIDEFEKWMTAVEMAPILSKRFGIEVSPRTLLDKGRVGIIPSTKINGRRKFRLSVVLAHYETRGPVA